MKNSDLPNISAEKMQLAIDLLSYLLKVERLDKEKLLKAKKKFAFKNGGVFKNSEILSVYKELLEHKELTESKKLLHVLQKKPVRTQSGVAPITVLTKPFPCPGKCIFCPNDIRMPKSYLSAEPGAQRAERNWFDPYLQTYSRLEALASIGHIVEKADFIVLGGTWSFYPESYQIWFIKECFRALNDFGSRKDDRARILQRYEKMQELLAKKEMYAPTNEPKNNEALSQNSLVFGVKMEKSYNQVVSEHYVAPERKLGFDAYQSATWEELEKEHLRNETALHKCVGLSLETRPDNISEAEVMRLRKLGCTKTQIGLQSLQDDVLEKNKRGHGVAASKRAFSLLRQAGLKIHAHWMANLYGSTPKKDQDDYLKLFTPEFCPDELKIYPCSLIESAELMQYYKKGLWKPFTHRELLEVLCFCLTHTPEYCRLTRVIRDIPSHDIVDGNKLTNFRQIAEQVLEKANQASMDIRAREVKKVQVTFDDVQLDSIVYETTVSSEVFLQFIVRPEKKELLREIGSKKPIAGFLRLSLPKRDGFIDELTGAALIREIHVYGQVVAIGQKKSGRAQHLGLGTKLIETAKKIAQKKGFEKLAVISAVGTREYYRSRGFIDGELYQFLHLSA